VSTSAGSGVVEPVGYAELLEQVKVRVRTSRVQAARAVNPELGGLYWSGEGQLPHQHRNVTKVPRSRGVSG